MPRNRTATRSIVTAPLSTSTVIASIGTSVCHRVTFAGFVADHEMTRRVSTPSTIRVRVFAMYELIGKFEFDTVSGGSTVTYGAPSTPPPIQSPTAAVSGTSIATNRFSPGPAGIDRGAGSVSRACSGDPAGVPATRSASFAVLNTPSRSASRQRETRETSPGTLTWPVTSTRIRRSEIDPVRVVRFSRSIGTFDCPGSTEAGARFVPRTVTTSPGGTEPGGRNINASWSVRLPV